MDGAECWTANPLVIFTPTDATDYSTPAAQTVLRTVNKAALSIVVISQSMNNGDTVPPLTGALSGVVAGDGITASDSTTRPPGTWQPLGAQAIFQPANFDEFGLNRSVICGGPLGTRRWVTFEDDHGNDSR